MKLSKNRLNKIMLRRNASRKKYKLTTPNGRYENSKKKNKRNTHIKRKTLKIYVGGLEKSSKSVKTSMTVPLVNNNSKTTETDAVTEDKTDPVTEDKTDPVTEDNTDAVIEDKTDAVIEDKTDDVSEDKTDAITDLVRNDIEDNIKKSVDTLRQYDCDPTQIDTIVPTDIKEAEEKYSQINDSILFCSEDNKIRLLDKWSEYIEKFETQFGKKPQGFTILTECNDLFLGEMNYNIVPITKELAEEKLEKYLNLLASNNNSNCQHSIEAALAIYFEKIHEKYPYIETGSNDVSADSSSDVSAVSTDGSSDVSAVSADGSSDVSAVSADDSNTVSSNGVVSTTDSKIITNDDIKNIFTKLTNGADKNTIPLNKFYSFLKNKTDDDSRLVRTAIGFDEPLTITEITAGVKSSDGNVINLPKNSQIIHSLFKTYNQFTTQTGGDNPSTENNIPMAELTEINEHLFTNFINCGQYRDKFKHIFDCKTVTNAMPIENPPSTSSETDTSGNLILEINEHEFNNTLKRVTLDVLIPKNADVVVRNYATNSVSETLAGISAIGM